MHSERGQARAAPSLTRTPQLPPPCATAQVGFDLALCADSSGLSVGMQTDEAGSVDFGGAQTRGDTILRREVGGRAGVRVRVRVRARTGLDLGFWARARANARALKSDARPNTTAVLGAQVLRAPRRAAPAGHGG